MVIKPLVRTISFEHNGTAYLVSFRWSFFRGVIDGEVWAAKGSSHSLKHIGLIRYGTENLWERIGHWAMVAEVYIRRRLRVFRSKRQLRTQASRVLQADRKT